MMWRFHTWAWVNIDRGGLRGEVVALLDPLLAPCGAPSEEHLGADSSLWPTYFLTPLGRALQFATRLV